MLLLLVKFKNFRGDPMLSFLEIDKSNVTDVSKDKNKIPTQEDLQEEVTFSKIFDDLIEDKEEDSQDIISFRGEESMEENNSQEESQQKASEIKEVPSRFENIVWSEDKFPKK